MDVEADRGVEDRIGCKENFRIRPAGAQGARLLHHRLRPRRVPFAREDAERLHARAKHRPDHHWALADEEARAPIEPRGIAIPHLSVGNQRRIVGGLDVACGHGVECGGTRSMRATATGPYPSMQPPVQLMQRRTR